MEQENSLTVKLFIPPRLSNAQVSAVKPQKNVEDGEFFQDFNKGMEDDYNLPFVTKNTSKHMRAMGHGSQKVTPVPEIDQENMETMGELYSRLYKEAENIKRWKVSIEYELKEKERKLQENRKIIEALRKAIQELQFENEGLSLKLEDEMHENKGLLKETNATRRWCSLLKETCAESLEKSNKYEHEQEETRQMYVELSNNIERMILAFEELRVQAENSRLEVYLKLKEEAGKAAQLENEYKREVHIMENQVSALTKQNDEKDNEIKDINIQLQDSRKLITELEEVKTQQQEMLKEAQSRHQGLLTEVEETKSYLQKAENACKSLETELQTSVATIIQLTEQKERIIEELQETRVIHSVTVFNLKELLEKEENRQKELRDQSDKLMLEFQNKSTELELITKLKNEKKKQVEEMVKTVESSIKIQKDLEYQLECERSEKTSLLKEREARHLDDSALQVQMEELLDGKRFLEETIEKLQEREKQLNDTVQIREKKIHDLGMQLSGEFEHKRSCSEQLAALKAELEKNLLRNEQLSMDRNKLLLDKEHIETEKSNLLKELKKCQEEIKDNRIIADKAEKQIENLEETNIQLRNELEYLKEKMKMTDEEAKSKMDASEENVRNTEKEMLKKEKQLKTLENKINSLKKQIENKTKHIEGLQQENKALRKKVATESKQSSITEEKVTTLQLKLENISQLHEETVESYRNEIEVAKAAEKKLLEEVEKVQSVAAEATAMKKVLDIQCQHKITEMVALMEKHKRQYDKTVEEKDTELGYYKTKEQQLTSSIKSLENELACKTNKLSSLQEQLEREIEEKENLAKEAKRGDVSKKEKQHKKLQTSFLETSKTDSLDALLVNSKQNTSQNFTPFNVNLLECTEKATLTPAKTYTVKTPPKSTLLKESIKLLSEEGIQKKRKVFLELDTRSESSDSNDLLSVTLEQERLKKLSKDYPPASYLCITTPKKVYTPSAQKTPGSSVKFAAMRKIRDAGWTAVSKMDRKKKMKEAGKLFT